MCDAKLSGVGEVMVKLVRALVNHPDGVRLNELKGEQCTLLEVAVAARDYGRVVGRKGQHVENLRLILGCLSGKAKRRYTLEIVEPHPDEKRAASPFAVSPDGEPAIDVSDLIRALVQAMVDQPDYVQVDSLHGTQSTVFEVRTLPADIKLLVGRSGRSAQAIRQLLQHIGLKHGWRYLLEVVE
jgi:predicted RNA-binding protein YlqC (UPF0109 family)